jgi:hypothetical protein
LCFSNTLKEYFNEKHWKLVGSPKFIKKLIGFMGGSEEPKFMQYIFDIIDELRGTMMILTMLIMLMLVLMMLRKIGDVNGDVDDDVDDDVDVDGTADNINLQVRNMLMKSLCSVPAIKSDTPVNFGTILFVLASSLFRPFWNKKFYCEILPLKYYLFARS